MSTRHNLPIITVGLILVAASVAQAGTVQFADVVFESQDNRKHPEAAERVIVVREDTGGPVDVCVGYINNNFDSPNAGVVSARVEIARAEEAGDGSLIKAIERVNISGPVKKNSFGGCKRVDRLRVGDSVTFPFVFEDFKRMKKDHIVAVAGALAIDGGDPGRRSACGSGSAAGLSEAGDGTAYLADVVFQAAEKQKHPSRAERSIIMREDTAGPVQVCVGYLKGFGDPEKGKLSSRVQVSRQETADDGTVNEVVERVKLSGKVRKGSVNKCKEIDALNAGDSVTFPIQAKGLERMSSGSLATIVAGVVVDSADAFRNITCTGGGGDGGGDGGGNGGGGSASNNQQAAQVLRGCATSSIGVQFQWDKGRLHADRRVGSSIETIGPFGSFAEAANAARARWSCGPGNAATADDGTQMNRLSTWGGVSGRRLALRFEKSGGSQVYVDAWSSATGAIHGPAHGSIGAAIRDFCGRSDISC